MTKLDTKTREETEKKTVRRWLVAAALAILAGIGLILINQGDETPVVDQPSDPESVIEAYVTAYNAGDIDAVMVLFTEESVLIGNAFDQGDGFAGLTEIRTVIEFDRSLVTSENAITISNVEVTGNTVTWDEEWDPDDGLTTSYCKGLSAVIEDGVILTWTWPDSDAVPCP